MFNRKRITLILFFLSSILFQQSHAAFPNDFSDVIFIDPNISSWAQTAAISVNVSGTRLAVSDSKRNVWPDAFNDGTNCCNRSLWIIVKYEGQWYAATFEFMRVGQVNKSTEAVNGQQIKRAPFLGPGKRWEPANGEVYGFMTSGVARFNLDNNNVQERSNVALFRWGEGPTNNIDFTEVPRGPDGRPIGEGECVEPPVPDVVNATHTYSGTATGTLTLTGAVNDTAVFSENISILVKDDRSLSFTVDDQTFNTTVAQDGSYSGSFNLDILGACTVPIGVNGTITGATSSGTATGTVSCLGSQATLNATFNAASQTTPSFIDQRPTTPRPRSVCGNDPLISPIINLLLD